MRIMVDLPDFTAGDEQSIELGRNVMSTVYAYTGIAANAKIFGDDDIDDALETALLAHGPATDFLCTCGVVNNMDGDVLHTHRLGILSAAVESVILVSESE